ncbi:MAG: arylesterase [Pseudomonadota bacterium]
MFPALFLIVLAGGLARADPIRLIALGDSLTAGFGLPEEEGFVPQLDRWLAENGHADVEVVNMGVSGDTSAGGLARVDWALGGGADAVLLELGANDMLRGIDPAVTEENLGGILTKLAAQDLPVLVSGMKAPGNYGPEYQEAYDAVFPTLAEQFGTLYDPFFLEGLVGRGDLFQPDGLHPNAEGVAVIVARIGPRVIELIDMAAQ